MTKRKLGYAHDMEQAEAWFHYIGVYRNARRQVWYWLLCALTEIHP